MTPQGKLRSFGEEIQNNQQYGTEIKNLIAIELFDFIEEKTDIQKEFNRHLKYFRDLIVSKEFIDIQDSLFSAINNVLALTDIKTVESEQWSATFTNRLNIKDKSTFSIPELYVILQDKNNYYDLAENKKIPTFSDELSIFTPTKAIIDQYKTAETLFNYLAVRLFNKNALKEQEYHKRIGEYNNVWYKFYDKIYKTPIKLHTRTFEDFFLFCAAIYPREGYESWHNLKLNWPETLPSLDSLKKYCKVVINDLIESLDVKVAKISANKSNKKVKTFDLNIDAVGDLWREPKSKYCYPMMEEHERQKILRYFVDNQTSKFIPTRDAASDLSKKTQYLRSEIGKINLSAASLKLRIKLIESKQGSGYRLNPNIKINVIAR